MISVGIKLQKAEIVPKIYKEKMSPKASNLDGVPTKKSVLIERPDNYYLIVAVNSPARSIIYGASFLVLLVELFLFSSFSLFYFVPIIMFTIGFFLNHLVYWIGVFALNHHGYRASYKYVSPEECAWVLMNGTR